MIIFILAALVLLMIQGGLSQAFGLTGNTVLLFGLSAIFYSKKNPLTISLVLGLMMDLASGLPDGIFLVAAPVTIFSLKSALNRFFSKRDQRYIEFLLVLASVLTFYLISISMIGLFNLLNLSAYVNWKRLIFDKLWLDLVLSAIFYYPVVWYHNRTLKLSRHARPV
ncbi:MAG: hypothetical protein A3H72_01095 [Candidatus Doudnabacteria bacterium RIFCSPLOWO2_02_FULL_48_8]|uniref:Rod shape-determining protein MreD n=1 Tax=Candidatus Doudnabacteria bacterium RIFCSPHIGHO2_01_FULL_46_24 TaxID=1817825 RepID=A0A1F5NV20_9BACT|nr:MAG: hypothetical protein A2720_02645 [Candidatus Doudnabacteria bacterium RIFCSPHIGHO2_01_FULL_46_24]OGE94248.1 MAG: hypothetical protein A3E98_00290 [Candidatus Doudnabacteria bacterium RIFCSPHIGHO2_12_FULL_48_11]OGE94996.1 MAG: hypothetical protein A3H72_01095 [Candidatus Doudnabacteria bacterium RIFCSPLOWO2_02_FULL_48_8]